MLLQIKSSFLHLKLLFNHITPLLKLRFPQNPGTHNQNGYQNRTGPYQKQYSSNHSHKYLKQNETLKLVGPLKFHHNILTELQKDVKNFKGGNLRYFSKSWYKYIKDKYILDVINNGLKLDLKQLPTQNSRSTCPLSSKKNKIISVEIKELLRKSVIVYSSPDEGEFISGIFTRDKRDGNKRMILNLKKKKFVNYNHFKMECINNVINLIKPDVFMASIDVKDASFSVP